MWKKTQIQESYFLDRLIAFAERYDCFLSSGESTIVRKLIAKEKFDSIKDWLSIKPDENRLPWTIREFAFMPKEEIAYFQALYMELSALIDEKMALYEEFLSYYQK